MRMADKLYDAVMKGLEGDGDECEGNDDNIEDRCDADGDADDEEEVLVGGGGDEEETDAEVGIGVDVREELQVEGGDEQISGDNTECRIYASASVTSDKSSQTVTKAIVSLSQEDNLANLFALRNQAVKS
jgi:hypothetical protein